MSPHAGDTGASPGPCRGPAVSLGQEELRRSSRSLPPQDRAPGFTRSTRGDPPPHSLCLLPDLHPPGDAARASGPRAESPLRVGPETVSGDWAAPSPQEPSLLVLLGRRFPSIVSSLPPQTRLLGACLSRSAVRWGAGCALGAGSLWVKCPRGEWWRHTVNSHSTEPPRQTPSQPSPLRGKRREQAAGRPFLTRLPEPHASSAGLPHFQAIVVGFGVPRPHQLSWGKMTSSCRAW